MAKLFKGIKQVTNSMFQSAVQANEATGYLFKLFLEGESNLRMMNMIFILVKQNMVISVKVN